MFAIAVVGIAADIAFLTLLLSWQRLSHLPDAQLGAVMLLATGLVLVAAPIAGVLGARSAWHWLDRLLS